MNGLGQQTDLQKKERVCPKHTILIAMKALKVD